jgi:hypothetical protein
MEQHTRNKAEPACRLNVNVGQVKVKVTHDDCSDSGRKAEPPDGRCLFHNFHGIGRSAGDWCGREDSNFHGVSPTATSTLRVYQFRHDRTAGMVSHLAREAV